MNLVLYLCVDSGENNTKVCGSWKQTCLFQSERFFKTMGLKRSMADLYNKKGKKTDKETSNSTDETQSETNEKSTNDDDDLSDEVPTSFLY